MERRQAVISVTVLLPENPQGAAYPHPILTTSDALIAADGRVIGQPVQHQGHSSPEDFTDDLLAKMNAQLGLVGLKISRAG